MKPARAMPFHSDTPESHASRSAFGEVMAWFILFPEVGGAVGFFGYLAAVLILENAYVSQDSGAVLSYGQAAMLGSLPLCTVIGAGIGGATALAMMRRFLASAMLRLLIGVGGTGLIATQWASDIVHHGRDPSEIVLYYPPLAYCGIALLLMAVAFTAAALRRRKL